MSDLSKLSDEELQKISEGKMDTLSDEALTHIAGESPQAPVAPAVKEGWEPYFKSREEFEAAKQRQMTDNPESFGAKAGMAGRALASATAKVGIPAAAVAAAPFTGGASLAAVGGLSAMSGEYLGNKIAGEETTPGGLLSAGIMGAAQMRSLPSATIPQMIGTGLKVGSAGALANAAQIVTDQGRAPTTSEIATPFALGAVAAPLMGRVMDSGSGAIRAETAASQDSVRRETLNAGRKLGLAVPPSVVSPGVVNDSLQSMAGKAATAQEAILRNQPKINSAVRAELGMADNVPLSPIALNTQRVGPNLVYDQIAKHSPESNGLLTQFKDTMDQVRELRVAYRASVDAGTPNNAVLAAARAAEAQADIFKQGLKKVLPKDLYESFDSARIKLAKIGLAERAVRLGDGNVDAKVFGDALEHGEKLTGNFKTIGRFQSAFGKYVQEAAKTPPSGVDYLKGVLKLGLGGGAGFTAGGVPGALAGVATVAAGERGSRNLILSPFYQNRFARPYYGPTTEDLSAGLARLGVMEAGRTN